MRIKIKEATSPEDELLSQLKGEMNKLIGGIEDTLEDKSKDQNESLLTTTGFILAVPAILGLIAKFGRFITNLVKKTIGLKPTDKKEEEQYFARLGKVADELHALYMKPLEIMMSKFIKDQVKAKKVAHFIFHIIVAVMLVASGVQAVRALQTTRISLATLETTLAAVKGGELKNYIAKLIA